MRELPDGEHTVCFNVGLITHIQAIVIAKAVEFGCIGIVTRADGIEVVLSV